MQTIYAQNGINLLFHHLKATHNSFHAQMISFVLILLLTYILGGSPLIIHVITPTTNQSFFNITPFTITSYYSTLGSRAYAVKGKYTFISSANVSNSDCTITGNINNTIVVLLDKEGPPYMIGCNGDTIGAFAAFTRVAQKKGALAVVCSTMVCFLFILKLINFGISFPFHYLVNFSIFISVT